MMTQETLKDYKRCILQPSYAIEKYFQVYDAESRVHIPFILTDNQKTLTTNLELYRFNVAKVTRLIGTSSILASWVSVKLAFCDMGNPEIIMYMSQSIGQSEYFMSEVKVYLNRLPRWLWGDEFFNDPNKSIFSTNSKRELVLPNSARLIARSATPDSVRGCTPTHFIMDSAAYINKGLDIYGAMMTSLYTGGKVTIISTPNGYDRFFKPLYDSATLMENGFNVSDLGWPYDFRFNKDLVWTKNGETIPEQDFTHASISRMLYYGWKPSSSWYVNMCQLGNNDQYYNDQELNGLFVRIRD